HEGENTTPLFDDWTALGIGSNNAGGSNVAGIVDDFGVWARGLNETEIGLIYNGGSGRPLMTDVLSAGTNTIAVEIHQASASSSDIRFDMMLRGETGSVGSNNVSDPIFFKEPATLKARSYNTDNKGWSALTEAFFSPEGTKADASKLVVSELHYHPANPDTPAERAASRDRDDFEFLELHNISEGSLDLTGVRFEAGINFAFPDHTVLQADKRLLLIRNRSAFEARYGPIEGMQSFEYTGRLSNGGEQLILKSDGLDPIHDFTYDDEPPWPSEADGNGVSLVLVKPAAGLPHGLPSNWTTSSQFGGSPGGAEPTALTYAAWAASSGAQGGPGDDDDQDGLSNFWEFLFGSRPDLASDAPGFSLTIRRADVDGQADDYLFLTYRRNLLANASLTVEVSRDLIHWTADPAMIKPVAQTDNGDGIATVTHRFARPVGQGQHRAFFRLRGQ
ncbi:MAG: lamin tail domain-containing protein, partial [Verrucomicrobiota bacterium]|nr:lamin tail domain-containing protein [Verrucomicrobiota bacterium]